MALLGHNGCGKSTMAKLFNGMLLPTAGKVLVDGIDTAVEETQLEVRRRVGLVLQNPDNQLVAAWWKRKWPLALRTWAFPQRRSAAGWTPP